MVWRNMAPRRAGDAGLDGRRRMETQTETEAEIGSICGRRKWGRGWRYSVMKKKSTELGEEMVKVIHK